jgi:hypothetical protein
MQGRAKGAVWREAVDVARCSVYWLFWYKSTNTDAAAAAGEMYVSGLSVQDPYDGHELTQRLSAATWLIIWQVHSKKKNRKKIGKMKGKSI